MRDAMGQLGRYPGSGRRHLAGTRRLVLGPFPYLLVYRIRGDEVVIIAVAHAAQKPGYWIGR
jgi:plasmid stabilization system protein ParE